MKRRPSPAPVPEAKVFPYETVPEAPGMPRQLYFAAPFNVYRNASDASDKVSARKEISDAPAVFTILKDPKDFRGRFLLIGDGEGHELGWVNIRESQAQEWNIRRVLVYNDVRLVSSVPTFEEPEEGNRRGSMSIPTSKIVPYFEGQEPDWYRIGGVKGTIGKKEWVRLRDDDQRIIATPGILVSEQSILRLGSNMRGVVEELKLLTENEWKGERGAELLAILQGLFTPLFVPVSGMDPKQKSGIDDYLKSNAGIDLLAMNHDDMAAMGPDAYGQWLNRIDGAVQRLSDIVSGKSVQSVSLFVNAKRQRLIAIPWEQMP